MCIKVLLPRSSMPCRPVRVLISTCVSATMRKSLTRAIQQLGGTVASDGPDFTHFVTLDAARGHKDRGFKKSINTLLALAAGQAVSAWPHAQDVIPASLLHRRP